MTQPPDRPSGAYDSASDDDQLVQVARKAKAASTPILKGMLENSESMLENSESEPKVSKPTDAEMNNLKTNLKNNPDMLWFVLFLDSSRLKPKNAARNY